MSIIIMQSIIFTHVFPTIINNFSKVITFVRANFILGLWCKQKWVWNQQKVCETYLAYVSQTFRCFQTPPGAVIVIKAFSREFDMLYVTNLKIMDFL